MSSKPPRRHPASPARQCQSAVHVGDGIIASVARQPCRSEQRSSQELLVSLGFALRSFTNLNRFLELVPVVSARLVGVDGALLVPFQADGRLWNGSDSDPDDGPFGFRAPGIESARAWSVCGFGSDDALVLGMDRLVQGQLGSAGVFATSLVARGRQRGRLYVFNPTGSLIWTRCASSAGAIGCRPHRCCDRK